MRPLLPQEKAKNGGDCIEVVGRDTLQLPQRVHGGGPHGLQDSEKLAFSFDRTYRGAGIGRQLFTELTEPLLRQFLNGFNATVSCAWRPYCRCLDSQCCLYSVNTRDAGSSKALGHLWKWRRLTNVGGCR